MPLGVSQGDVEVSNWVIHEKGALGLT